MVVYSPLKKLDRSLLLAYSCSQAFFMDVISPLTRLRSVDIIINTDPFHGLGENHVIKADTALY